MSKKIEAVVWDLDGTLVNSDAVVLDAFQHTLSHYGHRVTPADLEKMRSEHPQKVFKGYVPEQKWPEAFARLAEYSESQVLKVLAFQGVKEIIEKLHRNGIVIALWTGRDLESAEQILKANGLYSYFRCIVGGCMVARNKPYPDGLNLVSERLGISPTKMIVVGDHLHDLQGSKSVGATFVGAAWSPGNSAKYFAGKGADQVFDQISELARWLDLALGLKPVSE